MTVNDCCRTRVARNRETTTPRNQKVFFVFSCFRDFVIRHTSRACSGARRVGAAPAMIIAVAWISASAQNGSVPAPNNASPMITIDGVKGEAAWGAGTVTVPSPNTCTEFTTNTGTPVQAFGTRDAGNVYLALTIPDTSPSQFDHLLLFFDGNHAAGPALQADDVAFGFPSGVTTAPFANQKKYTGTSPTWTQSAAFPAAVQAAYTRSATEVVVELKIPNGEIGAAPNAAIGFAFVYVNQTAFTDVDCPGFPPGELIAFTVKWPSSVTIPPAATLPNVVNNPGAWGDLGKDIGTVTFTLPSCCSNPDIQFLGIGGTTFTGDSDVPITAIVHPEAGTNFDAHNVRVQLRVHKFGTGGPDIFNGMQPAPINVPKTSAGVLAGPGTWHTPNESFHACVKAELLAPTSADDYAIGTNSLAQKNVEVVKVEKSIRSRMEFNTFNPDKAATQTIRLVSARRGPRIDGLAFEVVQPLGPLQEATVALIATVPANAPTTDVPRQRVHVPPTAGRNDAVVLQVRAGDRVHIAATGDVDIDAGGPAPSAGPNGVDVSNVVRGTFLLSGRSASRVGGALIASIDGFETSSVIGAAQTITIPEKNQGLRLAVNDLVEGNRDNTGRGFDVEVWTLASAPRPVPDRAIAAAAPAEPPFPEVHIAAASFQQIKIAGVDRTYTVPTNLGAVTYQLLITDATANVPPSGGKSYWIALLVLILIVIGVLVVLRKRKTA